MDVNTLRTVLTLACFAVFIGIVLWTYSASRRGRFEEAARVPLMDDDRAERHFTTRGQEGAER